VRGSGVPRGPIGDGEEILVHSYGQEWVVTWHAPEAVPSGKPHGSGGICVTPDGNVILVSADGERWGLPGGRPEGTEDWEQTLRREMLEEACATVRTARLLGFSRGHCRKGREEGLVLVRAMWRADVELQPWEPRFEIRHRRLVPAVDLLSHLDVEHARYGEEGFMPTFRRAMIEARLG
jgi:ADP-ribose pyrophosphatase YjhB (NUDIX family)